MIIFLFFLFPLIWADIIDTGLTQCDCGFQDNLTQWSNVWHMNFANTPSPSKLYATQDLFFASYIIGAKHNDSMARVFRKENVNAIDDAIQVAVAVNKTDKQITCGGFGTTRQNFLYGSFRSYMKLTDVKGTVAGMFVYHPQGEIDIEIVSALSKPQTYFAVHPGLLDHGGASALTHGNWEFNFDPTADYHEYRFDWLPGLVVFYVDGNERYRMTTNILDQPGRVMFNHWTDSNANFSQGPVKEDAFLSIKNMTFFFNSTDTRLGCLTTLQTCNVQNIITAINNNLTTLEKITASVSSLIPSVSSPSDMAPSNALSTVLTHQYQIMWLVPLCLFTLVFL